MNITELTVHELQEKLKNKEINIEEITEAFLKKAQALFEESNEER